MIVDGPIDRVWNARFLKILTSFSVEIILTSDGVFNIKWSEFVKFGELFIFVKLFFCKFLGGRDLQCSFEVFFVLKLKITLITSEVITSEVMFFIIT